MRIFFFLLILSLTISVHGQNPKIEKANKLILQGKSAKAITLLKKTYKKTNDVEVAKKLISIYKEKNQTQNAIVWADKIGLMSSNSKDDVIEYAELLMNLNRFQNAIDHCLNYAIENDDLKGISEIAYACESLLKKEKESFRFNIKTVPFNTPYSEISIANYRKNFVMSSNGAAVFTQNNSSNFDLYMLQQDYNKWRYPWQLLRNKDQSINRTTICYSYNGNEVFYTLSPNTPISKSKKVKSIPPKFKIYHSLSLGDQWVETTLLPFQTDEFSYKDPALHPDEKTLVFSSDRNGNGDFDLFYCIKENGVWSKPIDLGSQINTKFEERMPYFKEDGQLYFASNYKYGFGGYDIYSTKLEGKVWIKSEILPPPINTKYDDLSISYNRGFSGGYITSNRIEGLGGYDIFAFDEFSLDLSINVVDNELGSLLSYAEVQLLRDGVLIEEQLTEKKGAVKFSVGPDIEYQLIVNKEGYIPSTRTISSKGKTNNETFYENVRLKKDKSNIKDEQLANQQFNNQNFVTYKALFENEMKEVLKNHPIKLVNVTKGKMKLLNTNSNGEIEQFLYIGNEYKIVIEYNDHTVIKDFSTSNLSAASVNQLTYTIPSKPFKNGLIDNGQ